MHKHQHQNIHLNRPIHVAILTVSDTRDYDSDKGGQLIQSLINQHENHVDINYYRIVKDDIEAITHQLKLWLTSSQRDVTIEAVRPLLTKELEGFGELFRYLSYTEDVGTRALLTRAIAGTCDNTLIFALPGSTGAIKLAIEKLIKPELSHLVFELNKDIRN